MEQIYGQSSGLKPSERKRLENLYKRRIGSNKLLNQELARTLADLSSDLRKAVSVLMDRSGKVTAVAVGDAKELPIPQVHLVEKRLSGFRLLHTHLNTDGLSAPDLSVLFLNRLDAIAALNVDSGHPGNLHIALMSPPKADEEDWQILTPKPYYEYTEWDIGAAVKSLEEELARQARVLELKDGSGERAVIVGVDSGEGVMAEVDLIELEELAHTAGAIVVHKELVFRPTLDPRYALGRGKIEELVSVAYHENAGTIIFGIDLSAAQAREIEAVTGLKILDRTQLILDIFAGHARTPESRVQVELAQLKYLFPRLVGKGKDLSRLGGGIGTRGPGETKLEQDRRRLQNRVTELTHKLEGISTRRFEARRRRGKSGVPLISVVGYTNAGKTTLMHSLAKAGDVGEDKLFATLRPLTRKGFLERIGEVLYTDTVGFIRRMPDDLIEAFRSTLEELRDSDILIHVLDISQEGYLERMSVVDDLLEELEVESKRILVFSKADQVDSFEIAALQRQYPGIAVSALSGYGIDDLKFGLRTALEKIGVKPAPWMTEYALTV